jgi:hypothetical protein
MAVALKTTPIPMTTTTQSMMIEWITNLETLEWVVGILLIFCIFLTIVIVVAYNYLASRRSYVYINIYTARGFHLIKYRRLPDASRCFTVATGGPETRLSVKNYGLFGVITFRTQPWKVIHSLTGARYPSRRHLIVKPGTAGEIKRLLAEPTCKVIPLIIHSHEYVIERAPQAMNALPREGGADTFV